MVDRRHEHQEASRHGDVGGESGALGAERFLDHLDEDFLPFLEQILDAGLRDDPSPRVNRGSPVVLIGARVDVPPRLRRQARRHRDRPLRPECRARHRAPAPPPGRPHRRPLRPFRISAGVDDLRDVEERVALEADVNKRRLHAGEDLRYPALVDVANHPALILALDEDLDDLVVLENGHARVVAVRGDDHLLVHGRSSRNEADGSRARRTLSCARTPAHAADSSSQVSTARESSARMHDQTAIADYVSS